MLLYRYWDTPGFFERYSMNNYFIDEYHFLDGSIYIAPRSKDRTDQQIMQDGQRIENTSPVYVALRAGLFAFQRRIKSGIDKTTAENGAKILMDFYRSLGRDVLNVK